MEFNLSYIHTVMCFATIKTSRGCSTSSINSKAREKSKCFFHTTGSPMSGGDRQTEVGGGAPLLQQSLMAATTCGTVSTTAITQVWSKMKGVEGEKRAWVCVDTSSCVFLLTHGCTNTHPSYKRWHLGVTGSQGPLPKHIKSSPELIPKPDYSRKNVTTYKRVSVSNVY